jgi:hypothetical protein
MADDRAPHMHLQQVQVPVRRSGWRAKPGSGGSIAPLWSPHFEKHLYLRHWRRQKWGDVEGCYNMLPSISMGNCSSPIFWTLAPRFRRGENGGGWERASPGVARRFGSLPKLQSSLTELQKRIYT